MSVFAPRFSYLITALFVAVGLLLWIIFTSKNIYYQRLNADDKEEMLKRDYEHSHLSQASVAQWQKQLTQLQNDYLRQKKLVYHWQSNSQLLTELTKAVEMSDSQLLEFQQQKEIAINNNVVIPVKIKISGSYQQIIHFFQYLSASIVVQNFDLIVQHDNTEQLLLTLTIYAFQSNNIN